MIKPILVHTRRVGTYCSDALRPCLLVLVVLAGCNRSGGPPRYDLSGSVTYNGKPVPAGCIVFTPDTSKGNAGPGTAADIRAGQYQTLPGQGTIGGPHQVSITGLDGKPVPYGEMTNPLGSTLFPVYNATVDLPREPATHDFVVPGAKK